MEQQKEMSPVLKALLGGLVGYAAGEIANRIYQDCSPQEKHEWKENRIMHHGELGCITLAAGATSASPFLAGMGAGMMVSDAHDVNEWFCDKKSPRSKKAKKRASR